MPRNKTKICPFCREPIDLLALKCVHCGERVGQPLGVERQLTIDDIGRPEEHTSEMSSSFVSAYERMNESSMTPDTKTLPPLPTARSARIKNFFWAIVAILVLIGLYNIGDYVIKGVLGMERNRKVMESEERMNQAERAAMSGDIIKAVQLGHEALNINTEDDKAVESVNKWSNELGDKARAMFNKGELQQALDFCNKAIAADPTNMGLSTLRKLILEDIRRYKIRVQAVNSDSARIVKPDNSVVTLKIGDKMTDLGFQLVSVDSARGIVVLRDTRRQRDLQLRL